MQGSLLQGRAGLSLLVKPRRVIVLEQPFQSTCPSQALGHTQGLVGVLCGSPQGLVCTYRTCLRLRESGAGRHLGSGAPPWGCIAPRLCQGRAAWGVEGRLCLLSVMHRVLRCPRGGRWLGLGRDVTCTPGPGLVRPFQGLLGWGRHQGRR